MYKEIKNNEKIDENILYKIFTDLFLLTNKELCQTSIDVTNSGTTAATVFIDKTKLYCINVGDSRAIIAKKSQDGIWSSVQISNDHNPSIPEERDRIIKAGGRIEKFKS